MSGRSPEQRAHEYQQMRADILENTGTPGQRAMTIAQRAYEARIPAVPLDSATRADALFASPLQPSTAPHRVQVETAVAAAVRRFGALGCAGRVAEAYGQNPETAAARMRWARQAVTS